MSQTRLSNALRSLPMPVAALLALALGALIGLAAVTPLLGGLGAPADRLTQWLLPLAGISLLLVVSVRSPLAGLLLTLLLAPYSRFIPFDLDVGAGIPALSLPRLMAGFLLLLLLYQAVRGQRRLRPLAWSDLAFVVFLLVLGLSVAESQYDTTFALQSLLDAYVLPFIYLYLARQIVRNLGDLRWFSATLVLAGVGFAFLVIREQLTGEVLLYGREAARYSRSFQKVISLMGNAAPMGVSTAMTLPLGLALLTRVYSPSAAPSRGRTVARVVLPVALAFIALGVYMTYNRASWLGMVITLLVMGALRPRLRRLLLPVLLALAILALVFWPSVVNSPAVNERLLEDQSIDYRSTVAQLALDMVREDPLLGLGYYNFGPIAEQRYGWDPASLVGIYPPAHNSLMFILVSGGLMALLPYVTWFVMVGWQGARRFLASAGQEETRDVLAAGAALLLLYFVASATFDNVEAVKMNLLFWTAIGAIWGGTQRGV
ncbi:MAG TPA: O-antigen ligase family protein [Anaerolineae bacterium]|nr:O-antigen ligase family protein [Anaerolineae bacterium]